jgi:hypothetical protein
VPVLGLDVAVDETDLVDGLETGKELGGDVLRLLELERASLLKNAEQRAAVDVLHRHQLAALDLDQVENAADVWRDDFPCRTDLLAEKIESTLGLEEIGAKCFQRDVDPELEIEGVPHLTHPAAAEHLEDLIAISEHLSLAERPHPLRHVKSFTLSAGRLLVARREFPVLHHSGTSAQPRWAVKSGSST